MLGLLGGSVVHCLALLASGWAPTYYDILANPLVIATLNSLAVASINVELRDFLLAFPHRTHP